MHRLDRINIRLFWRRVLNWREVGPRWLRLGRLFGSQGRRCGRPRMRKEDRFEFSALAIQEKALGLKGT